MRVAISNVITIEDPIPKIKQWCVDNLEMPNPEYIKKARMNLWLGRTPERIRLYEIHGNSLRLPFGVLRELIPMFKGSEIITEFVEPEKIDYHSAVELYDYQKDAVEQCVSKKYGILQSPAGSGKTQMAIAMICQYSERALWLTHTHDLLLQSKERAERYIDSSLLGTITEGKVNVGKGITFATIQTMCKVDLAQFKDTWDVIVCDECHRISGSPTTVTQYYKVLNALSARHKYGLSATVHRSDGMIAATHALIGQVIYTVPELAVADKIMKVGIRTVGTGIGMSPEFLNSDGTLNYTSMISWLAENEQRNQVILSELIREKGHHCLILSDRLEHLETLMNSLPENMRSDAVMVSGKMTSKSGKRQRDGAIEAMRKGEKLYLFATYGLAKEGLDVPCLDRLFLATPQKDYAVVTQSIGRIARTCEGKDEPIALDFVDDILYCRKAFKARCRTYKKNNCYFD